MNLRPNDIRFSQDSINNVFDKRSTHANRRIGETLDALLRGLCKISDIPTITVVQRNGAWYTTDNRRLWVFRKLEELGGCTTIPVRTGYHIPDSKLTTKNSGRSVVVRRDAGGSYWRTYRPGSSGRASTTYMSSTGYGTNRSSPLYQPQRGTASSSVSSLMYPRDVGSIGRNNTGIFLTTQTHVAENSRLKLGRPSSFHSPSPDSSLYSRSSSPRDPQIKLLDPEDVRYTKETIRAPPFGSSYQHTNPILVYRAFDENWALDGNRRLWSSKQARQYNMGQTIKAIVKDDEDEFLEKMRSDRPWLTVLDILQMGETVTVE
ncbi:uncharacterized protein LOC117330754 [Pecten maximus]|uniref:uncharacterized protein LOC117330754 n=1 Tax=Pecten maximus TaxID=6579 RepID=UPI001458B28D|nr:uncharacterized protein LOC117330754 [Pecten maximus]